MDENPKCDAVTFLIGSTFWPKTPFVTPSHSLLSQLFGPKRDFVTPSHSLLGQLYGPKRDQKLFKYSNKVKKLLKNSKNRECDDVTFLIGSTFWPRIYVANSVITSKNGLFSDGVT